MNFQNNKTIAHAIECFKSLPGIGPRSAERLIFHLLRMPEADVSQLSQAIIDLKRNIRVCKECFNFTEGENLCGICSDVGRSSREIMVVEEPLDVIALEKTARFKGRYHVLGGVIDPVRGIGPEEIRTKELSDKIHSLMSSGGVNEVIFATNPSTEGEMTAAYIKKILFDRFGESGFRITRIARGLPIGGDLEYADPVTLTRSLEGRSNF